jgi:hypothetical protein
MSAQGCNVKLKTCGRLFQILWSCLGKITKTNYSLLFLQKFTLFLHLVVLGAFRARARVLSHNFSTVATQDRRDRHRLSPFKTKTLLKSFVQITLSCKRLRGDKDDG